MKTVLIAEDDIETIRVLRVMFEMEGFAVDVVMTATKALGRIAESGIHAILLDMSMTATDMTTAEFFEKLALIKDRAPFAIHSGMPIEKLEPIALKSGAFTVLQKPCDMKTLIATVRAMMDKKATV
jgi:DNA-binding NtrC family response regulator